MLEHHGAPTSNGSCIDQVWKIRRYETCLVLFICKTVGRHNAETQFVRFYNSSYTHTIREMVCARVLSRKYMYKSRPRFRGDTERTDHLTHIRQPNFLIVLSLPLSHNKINFLSLICKEPLEKIPHFVKCGLA